MKCLSQAQNATYSLTEFSRETDWRTFTYKICICIYTHTLFFFKSKFEELALMVIDSGFMTPKSHGTSQQAGDS